MRRGASVAPSRCRAADRIGPKPSTHTTATGEQAPIRTRAFSWRWLRPVRRPAIAAPPLIRRPRYLWRAAEGISAVRRAAQSRAALRAEDGAYSDLPA